MEARLYCYDMSFFGFHRKRSNLYMIMIIIIIIVSVIIISSSIIAWLHFNHDNVAFATV